MIKEIIIKGEQFDARLSDTIKPWVETNLKDGYFTGADGKRIHYHYALNPDEKAAVVLSHGFCEFVGKYHEVMYYLYNMGYSVFFVEYRGMGFSEREVEEYDRVHVHDFYEYVSDLRAMVDLVAKPMSKTKRMYLFCHSMGGAVGCLFLEKYPKVFEKAVLSSPLLQMNFRGIPNWKVTALMIVSRILFWDKKYVPGQHGFDNKYAFETSSCLSEPRYAYVFRQRQQIKEYTSYGGTYSWTRAAIEATKKIAKFASKIETPILLFQAGMDTMVQPEGQANFVKKAKNVRFVRYDNCKHEIFNGPDEVLLDYYTRIEDFFENS